MNSVIYNPQALMNETFVNFVEWIDGTEKTTRTYLTNFKQFIAWLKYSGITQPERNDIIHYREWLESEHDAIKLDNNSPLGWSYRTDAQGQPLRMKCSANTTAQYIRSVKQFFKWTANNNIYPNIAENIKTPKVDSKHKKDALTASNVLTIEQSIKKHATERSQIAAQAAKDTAGRMQRNDEQGKRLHAMYLLAVNAGLRTVEISRANIKDMETVDGQTWLYIQGKGRSEADQKKPLAPEVAATIQEYISSRTDKPTGNSPLFVSTGNRSGGKRIAPTTISTMLKKAMKTAGFNSERITAHSLRHTAGTNVMEITGHNVFDTQMYMRHKNPKTTEIYIHAETEKQDATIAQELYNHYHNRTTTGSREQIERILDSMNNEKLEQLAMIAKALA